MKAISAGHAFGIVLVDELIRNGVSHVCISPGSRSTPLALAFAERAEVRTTVVHDERSSGFAALGIARATGAPVALLCTSGTAAANFHPAVVEADLSGLPLVVLTADRPPELRDTGANQSIDQMKLYGDSVRWFSEVGVPETLATSNAYWRSLACRAISEATGTSPGPVHLNCALREPLVPHGDPFPFPLDGRPENRPWTIVQDSRSTGISQEVLETILAARRGLIVAGADAAPEGIAALAEALGWPLLADPLSNARSGSYAISTYDALLRSSFKEDHVPDVVVRFGRLGISKSLMASVEDADEHILFEARGRSLDPARAVTRRVAANAADLLEAIGSRRTARDDAWLRSWLDAERTARDAIDSYLDGQPSLSEPRVARDLIAAIPDGASLFVGASMPLRDVEWFGAPRSDIRFFGNRGANGIDGSVGTPMGIAIATGAPTYALIGDISLLHDQNGLLLGGTSDLDLTIVCINNDGGGIFSFLPQAEDATHFERLFGTPHGRDLRLVAELHGAHYTLIESPTELHEVVTRPGGLRLVEVRTDRTENVRVHREIEAAVAAALG